MKAWRKQIFGVQTRRQVRGLAGGVMCETRDFSIQWPHWHTLLFDGQVAVDMRVVCTQDVKKMLLRHARMAYWKIWAATHACEELKEGVWLEPVQATLRRKTHEQWTDRHRSVTRKLVVKGCWVLYWLVRRKRSVANAAVEKTRRGTNCIAASVGAKSKSRSFQK